MHEPLPPPAFAPSAPALAEVAKPITPRSVAGEVVAMLRRPAPTLPPTPRPWLVLWRVVALYFIAMLATGALATLGGQAAGADHLMEKMRQAADTPGEKLGLLLLAGVVAPLWEETAFRLPLAPFHPWRVLPALALVALVFGMDALSVVAAGQSPPPSAWWPFVVSGTLGVPVIGALASPAWRARLEAWWNRNFRLVLALSILGFGFAHASNYRFSGSNPFAYALLPLMVLPQLAAGVLLSYVRLKLGFWFAVLLHSGVNSVLMLSVFLAPLPDEKPKPKPRPGGQPPLARRTPAPPLDPPSAPAR